MSLSDRSLLAHAEAEDAAHDGQGAQRWMVSYADFMTLLLVFFVALYAMSTQRNAKRDSVPAALASPHEAASAPVIPAPLVLAPVVSEPVIPAPVTATPEAPDEQRDEVLASLQIRLQPLVDTGQLQLARRGRQVSLEIPEDSLFASGEAVASPRAKGVIGSLARVLADSPYKIRVEGHTDNRAMSSTQYPSNWELSAARAATVVRALQQEGLAAARLSATGLADTQPKVDNLTEQGRARNRRVELVLLDN